ncbi:hypothetical protein QEH52_18590 [Coraliomargarita sp. SDUM461003]|uniref:DUF4231 domain-containing protein n=1 Tax=Thalassobacterium maritimum TaxID=3041265 RepID=A0ABU1B1T4_9BACT|nr:hypothetical protein [Coraliomargarita sp. SDUM461003]MDQ8209540.1 hypothetical protein [Coraliomargarita sp. SDUM461003]
MKNEDAIAEFILKKAETKESLRKIIQESAFEYYTGRYLFGTIGAILLAGTAAYVFTSRGFPIWSLIALAMSGAALIESKRNSGRVDAMVRLSNFKGGEPVAVVNARSAPRNSKNQQDD